MGLAVSRAGPRVGMHVWHGFALARALSRYNGALLGTHPTGAGAIVRRTLQPLGES